MKINSIILNTDEIELVSGGVGGVSTCEGTYNYSKKKCMEKCDDEVDVCISKCEDYANNEVDKCYNRISAYCAVVGATVGAVFYCSSILLLFGLGVYKNIRRRARVQSSV